MENNSITHVVVVSILTASICFWLLVKGGNKYDEPESEDEKE